MNRPVGTFCEKQVHRADDANKIGIPSPVATAREAFRYVSSIMQRDGTLILKQLTCQNISI